MLRLEVKSPDAIDKGYEIRHVCIRLDCHDLNGLFFHRFDENNQIFDTTFAYKPELPNRTDFIGNGHLASFAKLEENWMAWSVS
jgi:hypothetical protein